MYNPHTKTAGYNKDTEFIHRIKESGKNNYAQNCKLQ